MEMNKLVISSNQQKELHDDVLIPGFRFHPTDEELVSFYLKRKVEMKPPLSIDFIKNIDIYQYNPWDLPSMCNKTGTHQEWYFFCKRGRKYRNSVRPNRVIITGSGFWKATGIDRPIYSTTVGGSHHGRHGCVGLKKSLVFYRGASGKGTKTDWMMHEFRLPDHTTGVVKKSSNISQDEAEVWTLCRILKRDPSQRKYSHVPNVQQQKKLIEKPMLFMNASHGSHTETPTSLQSNNIDLFSETKTPDQVPFQRENWDELTSLLGYDQQPSVFMYSNE